jgi:hypothetical protein
MKAPDGPVPAGQAYDEAITAATPDRPSTVDAPAVPRRDREPGQDCADSGEQTLTEQICSLGSARYTRFCAHHGASRYRVGDNAVRVGWLPLDI